MFTTTNRVTLFIAVVALLISLFAAFDTRPKENRRKAASLEDRIRSLEEATGVRAWSVVEHPERTPGATLAVRDLDKVKDVSLSPEHDLNWLANIYAELKHTNAAPELQGIILRIAIRSDYQDCQSEFDFEAFHRRMVRLLTSIGLPAG